jgi:hypothetical protein
MVACPNGDLACTNHCQYCVIRKKPCQRFGIVPTFYCKCHIERKGHKDFNKLKTNNKSMMEFCGNSIKTCKSAETRRRNQTNAELMLCTIIVQMKCKSAETRRRNQTNAELMLCTIIVQMKYKSAETRRRNQTNAELMLCYVLLLYK